MIVNALGPLAVWATACQPSLPVYLTPTSPPSPGGYWVLWGSLPIPQKVRKKNRKNNNLQITVGGGVGSDNTLDYTTHVGPHQLSHDTISEITSLTACLDLPTW